MKRDPNPNANPSPSPNPNASPKPSPTPAPTPTPTPNQVISADLSYSDVKCADNRGAAVAGVLLQGETLHANHALVYGTLADGRAHEARLRPPLPVPLPLAQVCLAAATFSAELGHKRKANSPIAATLSLSLALTLSLTLAQVLVYVSICSLIGSLSVVSCKVCRS